MEKYGFDKEGLVVATAVNAYLKNLTPDVRGEILTKLIRQEGVDVVEGPALITLIENAKAAAIISAENWKLGEDDYQKALTFIRGQKHNILGLYYLTNLAADAYAADIPDLLFAAFSASWIVRIREAEKTALLELANIIIDSHFQSYVMYL